MYQYRRIESTGGAITLDSTPFNAASLPEPSTIILLVGVSDTDTVTLTYDDSQYGCLVNGNATLLRGYTLQLMYDDILERFIEMGRNF